MDHQFIALVEHDHNVELKFPEYLQRTKRVRYPGIVRDVQTNATVFVELCRSGPESLSKSLGSETRANGKAERRLRMPRHLQCAFVVHRTFP